MILDNLLRLSATGQSIHLRIPLIENFNADDAHIESVARFVRQLNLARIDLLPYHNTGSSKYERLGRRYDPAGFAAPAPERLARIAAVLRQVHPNVTIGGH